MNKEKVAQLEALLFNYGEALSLSRIDKILKLKKGEAKDLIQLLQTSLEERGSGLSLIIDKDKAQMVTHPDCAPILEQIVKAELKEDLSPAALETLAIITYTAPIPRSQIDYVRGVNSSFIIRNLLLRGLIDRETDSERKNIYLYSPSFELYQHLGISSSKELPEYENFSQALEKLQSGEDIPSLEGREEN